MKNDISHICLSQRHWKISLILGPEFFHLSEVKFETIYRDLANGSNVFRSIDSSRQSEGERERCTRAHDDKVLLVALVRLDTVHAVEPCDERVGVLHHVL